MTAVESRSAERSTMVAGLGRLDRRIAGAMLAVRRHAFVPRESAPFAYDDEPLALGYGEATISAPSMVALMLEAVDLRSGECVLEVGGGMGYLAALLAELVGPEGRVYAVEIDPALAREGERRLAAEGYADRVHVFARDGSAGLPELAPFDAVVVSCAATEILPAWKEQVRDGGRVVAPVGDRWQQLLLTYTRTGAHGSLRKGPACRFVPLRRAPAPHI